MNNSVDKNKKDRFVITEMFMAKADPTRCFFGIIKRFEDHLGNPLLFSKIVMPNDGFLCSQATDQKTLGKNLDEICIMVLDNGLHNYVGVTIEIFGSEYFLN